MALPHCRGGELEATSGLESKKLHNINDQINENVINELKSSIHDIKKTLNFMKEETFKPQATNNNKIKNPSYKDMVMKHQSKNKDNITDTSKEDHTNDNISKKPHKTTAFVAIIKNTIMKDTEKTFYSIRERLSQKFENLKLVKSNFSQSGLLFLSFHDEASLDYVLKNWTKNIFGVDSQAVKYEKNFTENQSHDILIRNVSPDITEGFIINHIKPLYPSLSKVVR